MSSIHDIRVDIHPTTGNLWLVCENDDSGEGCEWNVELPVNTSLADVQANAEDHEDAHR